MMFQRFVLLGLELKNVFLADLRGIRAGILAGVLIHATKHCDYIQFTPISIVTTARKHTRVYSYGISYGTWASSSIVAKFLNRYRDISTCCEYADNQPSR